MRMPCAPSGLYTPVGRETEEMDRRERERETVPTEIHPWDGRSSAPSSTKALGGDLKGPRVEASQNRKHHVSESRAPGKAA